MKNKRTIYVISVILLILTAIFYFSNSGINGIYKNYVFETIYPDSNPYLVIIDDKLYSIDFDGDKIRDIQKRYSRVIEKKNKFYFENEVNLNLIEFSANFFKLEVIYPGFDKEYERITGNKLPEDHLTRVLSPLLKSKIYSAIDALENNPSLYEQIKMKFQL